MRNEMHHEDRGHVEMAESEHTGHDHHRHMVEDFRRRFWVSLVLTVPILLLSPTAGCHSSRVGLSGGTCDPDRHHAARTLDRDAFGNGSI